MGKSSGRRQPRVGASPSDQKSARTGVDPSGWREESPAWRFRMLDTDGPYCWTSITAEKARALQERLASLETRRWKDILDDRSNHDYGVDELSTKDRNRVEKAFPSVDTLYQLRIQRRERIHGYRIQNVLHIIWWDDKHAVHPGKKL